jgi:hypothetical protein
MTIVVRPFESGSQTLAGAVLATLLFFGSPMADAFAAEIPFQALDADRCFMFSALVPYKTEGNKVEELPLELVINDQHDYEKLFDAKIMRQSCAGVERAEAFPRWTFPNKACSACGLPGRAPRWISERKFGKTTPRNGSSIPLRLSSLQCRARDPASKV